MSEGENGSVAYSVRRGGEGALASLRGAWGNRWVRWAAYLLGLALIGMLLIWVIFARDLPSADTLVDYEPDLPTMVRGVDGEIINTYARERRVQLQYKDYPLPLIRAFLSAEDKNFFSHSGLDYPGLASAVFDYVTKIGAITSPLPV